jgi:hypothetical protein
MIVISFSYDSQNIANSLVGDSVADLGFFSLSRDDSGQPEDPDVLGNVGLRNPEALFGFGYAAVVFEQPVKQPDTDRVSQSFEGFRFLKKAFIDPGHLMISRLNITTLLYNKN